MAAFLIYEAYVLSLRWPLQHLLPSSVLIGAVFYPSDKVSFAFSLLDKAMFKRFRKIILCRYGLLQGTVLPFKTYYEAHNA